MASTAKHIDSHFKEHTYAAHMGFWQAVRQDYGKKPGEASGSSTYIPLTEIKINDILEQSKKKYEYISETIERESERLASLLSRQNKTLDKLFGYLIREIIRNIEEHSEAESIWIAGQYWPSRRTVEIAILDEGIGIKNSLIRNRYYKDYIEDDLDALVLALEPGVSRTYSKTKKTTESVWDNSGYGLYMTSSLCTSLGGDFLICSGEKAILLEANGHEVVNTNFNGTAIRMRLNTDNINDIEKIRISLVKAVQARARSNSIHTIQSASKASKIFRITD